MRRVFLVIAFVSTMALRAEVKGAYVTYNDELYYEISNCNQMQPFFISLASDDDLWMYVSSTGSLTCGRQNPDFALFPYNTDDVILSTAELTGPKTIVQVRGLGSSKVWEPFSDRQAGKYAITRSIAKSVTGNRLRFSEVNHDLKLRFSYEWCATREDGWVRRAWLSNLHMRSQQVQVLDGVQNVVPAGIDRYTNMNMATLVDAYKRTERVASTPLFLFTMEATLVDRPEPSESLYANTAYFQFSTQPDNRISAIKYLASACQLDTFRCGRDVQAQPLSKGVRGAALASFVAHLPESGKSASEMSWYLVMNTRQNSAQVHNLMVQLQAAKLGSVAKQLESNMAKATATLRDIVALNDGVQSTADTASDARHFANTLFNTMRGGFYCDAYTIDTKAFAQHVHLFNHQLYQQYASFLNSLPAEMTYEALGDTIKSAQCTMHNAQLFRLYLEYLPITFSRRHGDPSRPWNLFNIRVNDANGKRIISYQGNWRDIFQNWEALSVSYPDYVNSIIAKFLNATTRDGYNPYRVTSEGIDWEKINPNDPWSNIGYWGDHQIIYLQKLLEIAYEHNPQMLYSFLNTPYFAFANVPYRIKGYDAIVSDPKATITFDAELDRQIGTLVAQYGADAKLIGAVDAQGVYQPMLVSFTEKMLITYLTKLSNFIPEAGIWMNTLRPEWNDANNALVGNGASMVTLCYMRRMVAFLQQLYAASPSGEYALTPELYRFFTSVNAALTELANELSPLTDARRRYYADLLGRAGEQYRNSVYSSPITNHQSTITNHQLASFLSNAQRCLDASIQANLRRDGLYEAYNLVAFTDKGVQIEHLYEMLEGQVAVLSSGALSADEVLKVLKAMRKSKLYREDQRSYTLYPFKQLPSFVTKNTFSLTDPSALSNAIQAGILLRDQKGYYHFSGECNNAKSLAAAVARYNTTAAQPVSLSEQQQLTQLYEQTFHHHAFTGRSGSMYKYEGLGSIYWHMVSKLKLAVAENIAQSSITNHQSPITNQLIAAYHEIDEGIGSHKQPEEYGSFPFDAYSHTPSMAGVQQPGMTGQVKEDILSRFIELGIRVSDGKISIDPCMLTRDMFRDGELSFTYCGTKFIYTLSPQSSNLQLDAETSRHIFARDGQVLVVNVQISLAPQAEVLLTAASGEKCQTMPSVTFRHTNAQPMDGAVVIDIKDRRQTIDGIGTSLTESSAFVLACLSEEERQQILQDLFGKDGAAFSLARTQIGASDFSVEGFYSLCETPDDTLMTTFSLDRDKEGFPRSKYPQIQNEHYDLYHLMKDICNLQPATSNLKIVANTWTAPHWMKDNNAYYQDHEHGSRGGVLLEKYYPAYARYLVKYLEAWRAEGVDIWAITPVNEPQGNGGGWESMDFYPVPEADFIANHLGPQLAAAGFGDVDILGFDQNVFEAMPYAEAIYGNADAKKYTTGLAMHWYGGTKTVYPETLDSIHNMAPDKKLIHTEGCIDNLGCPAWPGVTDEEGFVESGWFNNDSFWWSPVATDWAYSTPFDNGNHPKYAAAHRYASFIIDGMNHWLTGFIDWNCVLDSIGGPNHVSNFTGAPVMVSPSTVYYTPVYYVLKQLSRTLRPGDVVLASHLSPLTSHLHILATQRQDGHYTIQVENEATEPKTFPLYIGKYKADITAPANSLMTLIINQQ